uniref:NADH dehydrogenase subunit 6 n=1 Tax=Membranipora grandicella TaxID=192923 RepID=I6M199_9BILA|nr:NADH dehydrogenase subunit 6 [Membranipora grandicella]AEH99608.1 NADH dehydrogenase subunit 6 [Membranipora grandicella]
MSIFTILLMMIPFMESMLLLAFSVLLLALYTCLWLIQTINLAYGMITFLIYITGMLVLFSYVLAMTPNFINSNNKYLLTIFLLTFMMNNNDKLKLVPQKSDMNMDLTSILMKESSYLYFLVIIFLLMVMIAVSCICFKSGAPLRKNY